MISTKEEEPMPTGVYPRKSLSERFWSKVVVPENENDCWLWLAAKDRRGYGAIGSGNRVLKAHRVSWELHHGNIPDNLLVCHRCDNPGCCNPKHLFLGTQADNMADCSAKGRWRGPHPQILTAADIPVIRQAYVNGETYASIGERYDVHLAVIHCAVRRITWKHIP